MTAQTKDNEEVFVKAIANFDIVSIPTAETLMAKSTDETKDKDKEIFDAIIEKNYKPNEELEYGEVIVLATDPTTDSDGESLSVPGIDLTRIKKQPTVLWSHDRYGLPLGQIKEIKKQGKELYCKVKFDYDIYQFADIIYKMVLRGTIRSVSIGGVVKEYGKTKSGAYDRSILAKTEMHELSFVNIGSNPNALVVAKQYGYSEQDFEKEYHQFFRNRDILKSDAQDKTLEAIAKSVESLHTDVSALAAALQAARVPDEKKATTAAQKQIILNRRLVYAKTNAKAVDKTAERIIAGINLALEGNKSHDSTKPTSGESSAASD